MFPANLVEATFKQVSRSWLWRGGTGEEERRGYLSMVVTRAGRLPVSYRALPRGRGLGAFSEKVLELSKGQKLWAVRFMGTSLEEGVKMNDRASGRRGWEIGVEQGTTWR